MPSALREAQLANDQRGDSEPDGLTAAAKFRVAKAFSGERAAGSEGGKTLGSPPFRWWRLLAPSSIVLLGLAVIFLIKFVGAPPQWWPL